MAADLHRIATGSKGDVVGQVDGGPSFVDKAGKPVASMADAAMDANGAPQSEIDANPNLKQNPGY